MYTSDGGESKHSYNSMDWVQVVAASATLFVGVGYSNTFGVFQDYYEAETLTHLPVEQIILIGSLASSLYLILGAFTGCFADIAGYRTSLIIGASLMIGSMFAASVATEYWHLLLSQGLMFGLGVAFVYMPVTSISRQYFGESHYGLVNAIVVSGGALGGCVLPYSVKIMIANYGLSGTFRALGYLAAGTLVPSIALLRPKTKPLPFQPGCRLPLFSFKLLRNTKFNALIISSTIAMIGFLPRYFLVSRSAQAQGIGSGYAAWLLGMMNGISILGRIGVGYVADRYGQVGALAASFILCGLAHIMLWLPGVLVGHGSSSATVTFFTLFVVLVGILGSGFISLFPVVIAHLFGPENLASKTGLLNTVVGLGVLSGPSAVYAIIGSGDSARWFAGVLFSGGLMLAGGFSLALTLFVMRNCEIRANERVNV